MTSSSGRSGSVSSSGFTELPRIAICGQSGWSRRVCSRSRPSSPSGKMLEQQPARGPMALALLRRQPDQARDLLRLGEITLRRLAEVPALQRHDPLIALVGDRLIEGDRQKTIAEQLLQRRLGSKPRQAAPDRGAHSRAARRRDNRRPADRRSPPPVCACSVSCPCGSFSNEPSSAVSVSASASSCSIAGG